MSQSEVARKPVSIFTAPPNLPPEELRVRKHMLARLAIAWLAMMQTMMFAFPGYIKVESSVMDNVQMLDNAVIVMNWLSLVISIPVITYCAWPIWWGMLGENKDNLLHINMNWPIALGIVVAFIPSAINTWREAGEVYFESVSMFIAFLLTARYMEFCAQQSARFLPKSVPSVISTCKKRMTKHADYIAFWFVFIQIGLAVVSAMVWLVWINQHYALPVLVALFVMSCPCALSISVPTAFSAARAIVLNNPNLSKSEYVLISEKACRCAKQNLYGSLIWHLAMTPLAMVGIVSPWFAAFTMLISSLAVALNAWIFYKRYNKAQVWAKPVTLEA